jgi:hypothetical protein
VIGSSQLVIFLKYWEALCGLKINSSADVLIRIKRKRAGQQKRKRLVIIESPGVEYSDGY